MTTPVRRALGALARPLLRQGARVWLRGTSLRDALANAARHRRAGHAVALGYWNAPGEDPAAVLAQNRLGVAALEAGDVLAVKLPSLGADPDVLDALIEAAAVRGVTLHADSLAPETADTVLAAARAGAGGRGAVGVTLPGRWRRSPADAEALGGRVPCVRVVKGEWADPACPELDPREGFLAVVDRLAGRAARVAIATHDAPLAREALSRLRARGTTADLEVLHGLPLRAVLRVGRRAGVRVRAYVPWGAALLPYAEGWVRARPRVALAALRDRLGL